MVEEWRPVINWEGFYEVSDYGRVRSVERVVEFGDRTRRVLSCVLSPGKRGKGKVPYVLLSGGGNRHARSVHALVLEAFVGPCPDGLEACHWDGNNTNNHVTNLRWDTRTANMADMLRHGRHHHGTTTSCPAGHEYTPENTKAVKNGRACRECHRIDGRERYQRDLENQRAYRREQMRRSRADRKAR
jgi:hypothetical protein